MEHKGLAKHKEMLRNAKGFCAVADIKCSSGNHNNAHFVVEGGGVIFFVKRYLLIHFH